MEFLRIPWNSTELLVSSKLAHPKFHGIPTARFIEIDALQVPRNSMDLLVSAKLAHSKSHGIPWNCSCQRNWRTSSSMDSMEFHCTAQVNGIGALEIPRNSMEFHGTARISEIGSLQVPWNAMEFHGTAGVSKIGATHVPRNSMELLVSAKLAHLKFYGIPCSFHRNWRTPCSTEFHGEDSFTNWCVIINICIIPFALPALLITYQNIIQISFQCSLKLILIKKFRGTLSRVPWNFLNNIWTTPVVPWKSMELEQQNLMFHGIPWNSMEFCPDLKFHGIPWNFFHTPEFSMELDKFHI